MIFGFVLPVLLIQTGTITGVLRSEAALPVSGARVSVMAQPDKAADAANVASLISIAETDDNGRFRLENVPAGRYFITAGRVEQPTYYPGTLDIAAGRVVAVGTNETVSGIDFALKDVSDRAIETVNAALRIPLRLQVEAETRIPVFSERGRVRLRLTHLPDGNRTEVPLNFDALTLPIAAGEYRVEIANLPDGYAVAALRFGAIDLMRDSLTITRDDLPKPQQGEQMFLTSTLTGIVLQRRIESSGTNPQYTVSGIITSTKPLTLSLTANRSSAVPSSGVSVRGKVGTEGQQEVYLSGARGTLFADGTFEFRGVAPGRHVVAMLGLSASSRLFGAVLSVDRADVDNVQLQETISLPMDVLTPKANAAEAAVGPAMHTLRGHVVNESNSPVAGIVTFQGYARSITYSLPADGEFEIPNLLPGSYGLRVETFERSSLTRTVIVENDDVDLKLVALKNKTP